QRRRSLGAPHLHEVGDHIEAAPVGGDLPEQSLLTPTHRRRIARQHLPVALIADGGQNPVERDQLHCGPDRPHVIQAGTVRVAALGRGNQPVTKLAVALRPLPRWALRITCALLALALPISPSSFNLQGIRRSAAPGGGPSSAGQPAGSSAQASNAEYHTASSSGGGAAGLDGSGGFGGANR